MKHRIVPLTVVAMCLGLPTLALAQPGVRGEPGRPLEHRDVPPPGARPLPPMGHEGAVRYEEHLRLEQEAARAHRRESLRDERHWDEEREARALAHRRAIAMQWAHIADMRGASAELSIHADRMARLNRALDLAEEATDAMMINRIHGLIGRENARHARTMASIQAGAL